MNYLRDNQQYKCMYFLAILSMMLMSCCGVLGNKLITTPVGVLSAASLVSPFWFALGDVITEVYGYKTSMKVFWLVTICQFIFGLVCYFMIRLDSPASWHGQQSYELVVGHLLFFSVFQSIGIAVSWSVNAKLLSRWRILTRGKYFWLRSIGSSGMGVLIFSILSVSLSIAGMYSLQEIISIVTWSCILKITFIAILSFPNTYLVILLRRLEGFNEADYFQDYTGVFRTNN